MSGGAAGCTRGPGVALAIVTSAFSAMLLSANLATPLYAVWARQFGFSTAVLALIFAVYALVLVPALLTFGQLSDRLGRRVVIAIGLDPSRALVLSQVVLSFGIPFALVPLLLFCRDRGLMGSLVNKTSTTVLATGVVTLIVGLNAFLIFLLVTGK